VSEHGNPGSQPNGRATVDPALAFGIALALSLVLWWPSLRGTLDGNIDITTAGLHYLAALGISWAGVFAVATVFATYGHQSQATAAPQPPSPSPAEHPLRRADDPLDDGAPALDVDEVIEPPAA
jgi:hypothetical protein